MLTRQEIWSEFQENYRYAHDYWSPFVSNAQVYTLAASGYTWSEKERLQLDKEGREPLEMNIMRRPLQFFSGYLRDNLNSIVIAPVEGSDQKTADQMTKLSYYTWDKGEGYSIFLDAADEMMKSGMSLCGIQMDYSRDFINGDISFYKRTFNQFYLDPTFERIDLRDCGFAVMRDLLDRNVVKQLLPFVDPKEIDDIQNAFRDDKFLSYHPNFTTLSRNRNLMAYDQYYKRTTRKRTFLVDETASFFRDVTDIDDEEMKKLKLGIYRMKKMREEAEEMGVDEENLPPLLDLRHENRPYIELHIMLNAQEVYNGSDKTGIVETYPFAPLICYMEPSIWMPSQRMQGISASLYSAQRQFNKRHMKIVDMMDSTVSTGFQYMVGAVADPQDLQQSGQNKIIGLDPEDPSVQKFGQDAVRQLNGGGANPALIEYQAVLDQLTLTLANVNESVLGVDEKGNTQVSGRLAQVRIAQGLRSNRKIFDNIELSQKILGGLILKAIQLNMPPGKVERIIGEKPTQQFYEREFEQYDAVIKEGVRSQSQRDAYYYELVQLKKDGIVDVPQPEIVRALQMAGVDDLQKSIEQQQQQVQQAQKLAMQKEAKEMEKTDSEIAANVGLAGERKSREASNYGLMDERESEVIQNKSQAILDRAKAITEISKLRDDRILQVAQFLHQMEMQEKEQQMQQQQSVEHRAHQGNRDVRGTVEEKQVSQAAQQLQSNSSVP